MKRFVIIVLALVAAALFFGCSKKEKALEEMQTPISFDALSEGAQAPTQMPGIQPGAKMEPAPLPLPPGGPYKPTAKEIQTALKNAGFYNGSIDGTIGPKSKKAIEEFQKANGLTADGKVGPKTWAALSKYLNPAPSSPATVTPATK